MFNNMFFYLFICLLFFGIGDFLSVLTKAKVSSVFVSLLLFLIAFITGIIPPDIIKQAGLADFGKWAILFIVFSLGTTINLRELIDEWPDARRVLHRDGARCRDRVRSDPGDRQE